MRRGEKVFFFHIPLATKQWNIPLATKLWNIPLATKLGTFHWPPKFGSTFTPLLLLFKMRTWFIGGLYFPEHNFQFNLEYLFRQAF
jgi:hypothetical protein